MDCIAVNKVMDITNTETGTSTTKVNRIEIAAAKIYMPWQLHVNKPSIFRCIIPHKIDDKKYGNLPD
jgi:hypothetical protein